MKRNLHACMKASTILFAFLFVHFSQAQITNQTPSINPTMICGSGTATVSIPASQVGVTYGLIASTNTTALVGSAVSGTGNALSFPTGTVSVTTTFAVVGVIPGTSTMVMNP